MKSVSGEKAALLVRFFIPYAVILVGSLLVGWFAYGKTAELIESETVRTTSAALQQIQEALDQRFAEIENLARQMSSESKVLSFQFEKEPFAGTGPYRLWDLEKSLFNYKLFNHFIVDYYIAYRNSNMIVSPRKVYTVDQYYRMQLHYDDQPLSEWKQALFGQYHYKTYAPGHSVVYEGKPYSVVSYMQSFGNKRSSGVVTVLINNMQIQDMLRKVDPEQEGFAYIADQNGNLISSIGLKEPDVLKALPKKGGYSHIRLGGQEMLVTQSTSQYNGWSYVSAQPKSVVLQKVNYIKQLTLAIFITALLLGLGIAGYLAYRSSRPFLKILQLLPSSRRDVKHAIARNAVDYIGHSVSELIESHHTLKERLEEQIPMLRNVVVDRLLKGGFTSMQEIDAAMEHAQVQLRGSHHAVALLHIRGYREPFMEEMLMELDIVKINIRDRIQSLCGEEVLLHDFGENQLVLILSGTAADHADFTTRMRAYIKGIYEHLSAIPDTGLYIAVGECQSSIAELYRSYGEARFVLHHAGWSEKTPILFHAEMETPPFTYYYPADEEMRLIQLVKAGNLDETKQLLLQIKEKNRSERQLPMAVEKLLAQELSGTLMKCCEQTGDDGSGRTEEMDAVIRALHPVMSPAEAMNILHTAFIRLCRKNEERKKSHNDHLTNRLLTYIKGHYWESDLSLTALARETRTSEAYVSYFFKEQTGLNFSDYLEQLRMDEAKRELSSGDRPVSEIAASVGYLSLNTFSRAFKRVNGISATEYRRLQREGEHA
ncbi:helix-turn-helix domain-containing protein [Paenibacillus sp. p3-SID867]|uniref:helix-turn-helix domain-containing protein n=1 Tax=Paenibacillus sp. p3-SID867 TaxID=2916363 RepID=UPI0021A3156B|nr:helix-turn-helix domain-containing protein [Paenibacillus sp. p3-SID867]MCT1403121.1 helix-turn-helix domain-containing protein [Paenibacillus sp. p3-SID867]